MTLTQGSRRTPSGVRRMHYALAGIACLGLTAAGCGSSPGSSGAAAGKTAAGEVKVAYASSLEYLNSKLFVPAFVKATGYKYTDWVNSAGALESEIASGEIAANVFESVGGANIVPLEPKYTSWYVQYAATSMVVAYNPNSKYASQFKAIASGKEPLKNLFSLMEEPGFKLGRTDPNIDPQGRSFIDMLELAQLAYHLPADTVAKIIGTPFGSASSPQIYSEASLDSTLQSGQLDAASAYQNQAVELHLPYITLPAAINQGDFADAADYAKVSVTITDNGQKKTLSGVPLVLDVTIIGKPAAASLAYVKYLLSPAGQQLYRQGGYTVLTPKATGTNVPVAVRSELGG